MPLTTSIDDLLAAASSQVSAAAEDGATNPVYTGRYIAIFKDDATDAAVTQFQDTYNLKVASAASFEDQAVPFEDLGDAEVLVFPSLGAALVSAEAYASMNPAKSSDEIGIAALPADSNPSIASLEPEVFVYANDPGVAAAASTTYGLDLTAVTQSSYSGDSIKVCILDTGFDLNHPDFAGRTIVSRSFVGQPVQDGHGHGTHTAGTACGPQDPGSGNPRYGVAYDAQMYIGKVLSDKGVGTTATTLAGIAWALANACEVVSMSLSAPVGVQTSYTQAGTKALAQGTLLVAAAGNESKRPGSIAQAGAPANSPTFMSVAALDSNLNIAPFRTAARLRSRGPAWMFSPRCPHLPCTGRKAAPVWLPHTSRASPRCGRRAMSASAARLCGPPSLVLPSRSALRTVMLAQASFRRLQRRVFASERRTLGRRSELGGHRGVSRFAARRGPRAQAYRLYHRRRA